MPSQVLRLVLSAVMVLSASAFAFVGHTASPLVSRSSSSRSSGNRLSMLAVGEEAPDFTLQDSKGKPFKLSSLKGKNKVIFFYPKDDTPGCTIECVTFNDNLADFKKAGVEVVGISSDEDHTAFVESQKLEGLRLLSDVGGKVRKQYAVPKALFGFLDGRVSYFVGKDGIVNGIYDNIGDAKGHVTKAKEAFNVK